MKTSVCFLFLHVTYSNPCPGTDELRQIVVELLR